jgi:hypothetical protein
MGRCSPSAWSSAETFLRAMRESLGWRRSAGPAAGGLGAGPVAQPAGRELGRIGRLRHHHDLAREGHVRGTIGPPRERRVTGGAPRTLGWIWIVEAGAAAAS